MKRLSIELLKVSKTWSSSSFWHRVWSISRMRSHLHCLAPFGSLRRFTWINLGRVGKCSVSVLYLRALLLQYDVWTGNFPYGMPTTWNASQLEYLRNRVYANSNRGRDRRPTGSFRTIKWGRRIHRTSMHWARCRSFIFRRTNWMTRGFITGRRRLGQRFILF